MKKMQTLTVNGNAYQISDSEAVSFATAQTLTPEQQQQAKENLGLGGQFELIEDITLTEDNPAFFRTEDTNGVPYDFSAVRVFVTAPALPEGTSRIQIIFSMDNSAAKNMIYHQVYGIATVIRNTCCIARNDGGLIDYFATQTDATGSTSHEVRNYYLCRSWKNVTKIKLSTYPENTTIPAGTQIKIYAIRG